MKQYIIIPTYNEIENIQRIIHEIFELHPEFYIIVVDDNSPDGTGKLVDDLSRKDSRIHIIHRPKKAGLGTAYVTGFKEAIARGADLIFEMDADFSHDPKYLKDFLEASKEADLIIGSRYINGVRVEGWRFRRLLLSKLANIFVSFIIVKPVWDFTAGFRCYKRKVLEKINLSKIKSDGYAFQIEMTYQVYKNGFRVMEVPIIFKERLHGGSKISRRVVWEAIWITFQCHAPFWEIIKHLSYLFKEYDEFTQKNDR